MISMISLERRASASPQPVGPVLLLLLLSACGGGDGSTAPGGTVAELRVDLGAGQSVEIGEALPQGVTVRTLDALGAPVGGASVTTGGDGQFSPPSATTGSDGRATFQWAPSARSGAQTLRFEAGGRSTVSTIDVRPTALVVRLLSTSAASGEIGTPLADSVRVEVVRARDGAPQRDVAVRFVVASGGGGVSTAERVTDAAGRAAVRWTLGPAVGAQSLRAEVAATPNTTSASATVVASALAPALTALSVTPNPLTLTAGTSQALSVTPTRANAGVAVDYTYSTSAPAVATVSVTGVVTAVAIGTATITVTGTGSGSGFTTSQRTVMVTLTVAPRPTGRGFGSDEFALIPAGEFQMGSTNGRTDERPVRTVTISSFRMQRTEVTQAQWRQVMQGAGRENPSAFSTCGDTCPVELVSWNDIQTFLTRLNQQDPGKNYRLPTEAEWEFAARAGTTGDYGGNGVLNDMGWWSGNSNSRTHPVAQKLPNAWGLHDMHGNVWEWVNDWYSATYYSTGPTANPPGPTTGSSRGLRGGSWSLDANLARSAFRLTNVPSTRSDIFGFRLARTP